MSETKDPLVQEVNDKGYRLEDYTIISVYQEDGTILSSVLELCGCAAVSEGPDFSKLEVSFAIYVKHMLEEGKPIPPSVRDSFSCQLWWTPEEGHYFKQKHNRANITFR